MVFFFYFISNAIKGTKRRRSMSSANESSSSHSDLANTFDSPSTDKIMRDFQKILFGMLETIESPRKRNEIKLRTTEFLYTSLNDKNGSRSNINDDVTSKTFSRLVTDELSCVDEADRTAFKVDLIHHISGLVKKELKNQKNGE